MRVVFNQWAASGRKTGIGHHAAELRHHLPCFAGADEVCFFPPAWVLRYRELWGKLMSGPSAAGAGGGAPPSALQRAKTWAREVLRRCGRAFNSWHFRRFCTDHRIDLYHEPNYITLPSDVPTVVTLHDLSVLLHPEWHPADRVAHFERHFQDTLRRSSHVITVSDFTRREVIEELGVPAERVTRVYNGIRPNLAPMPRPEVEAALRRLELPEQYLLHVGTIEPRKNLMTLLRAYCGLPPALRERCPLLLVGGWGWNVQELRDYWQAEARFRGVLHLGYVEDEDLAAIYNGARALFCPSLYEGFGLPPVEMLACGGAVVCSTAAALVETAGARAHLVEPEDGDGWRAALRRAAEDDDWCEGLRVGAVEAARPFTWERCAAETWAVYRQVHGGARAIPQAPRRAA
jgi:alpha-1,3-rhamnosyl/mannosyltransferase